MAAASVPDARDDLGGHGGSTDLCAVTSTGVTPPEMDGRRRRDAALTPMMRRGNGSEWVVRDMYGALCSSVTLRAVKLTSAL